MLRGYNTMVFAYSTLTSACVAQYLSAIVCVVPLAGLPTLRRRDVKNKGDRKSLKLTLGLGTGATKPERGRRTALVRGRRQRKRGTQSRGATVVAAATAV